MTNSMLIGSQAYDKTTIKAAMGNILATRELGGKHFSDVETDKLIKDAVELGLIEQGWAESKIKAKNTSSASNPVNELLKNVSFDMAYNNDADLAALYLYKIKNAKDRGIVWDLSLADLRNILKRKRCYYSGSEIVRNSADKNRPTLDRIDNKKGYTKENTVICSYWVNQLKNELFENPRSEFLTDMKTLLKILKNIQK